MTRFPFTRLGTRLVALVLALGAFSVRCAEPLDLDLDLLDALNERKLFEYSRLHVDKMLRLYPEAKDRVLLAKARTLYAARASAEAADVIKQIPKDSPHFPEAMLLVGEASARVRNYDAAVAAYGVFFRKGEVEKRLPDGDDEDAVAEFRRHVSIYKSVLEKKGNAKEAQRIVALLGEVQGAADERGTKFLQTRTVLDIEEGKLDQQKPVNEAAVEKALAELEKLVFLRDGVGALSYIEMARCHVILGGSKLNAVVRKGIKDQKALNAALANIRHFIEAVNVLQPAGPFLEEMAAAQGAGDELLAGALYYQGKAYRGQSLSMHFRKQPAKAESLMKAAAQCFEKVAAEFGESRFQGPALAEHEKCRQNAQQLFGAEIQLAENDGSAALQLNLEKGHSLFQRKQYKDAIPVYLVGARAGRLSKKLPTIVSPLVVALGEEGYFVEAEALASYLVEFLPKDEMTALCVLQLGASLKKAAKAAKDAVEKERLEERAITAWEWFVEVAPLDNRAPMVAYAVADQRYGKAVALGRQAKDEKDRERREELVRQARAAMEAAIPKFRFVVDQYGTSSHAPGALYKLGWCYYETDQHKEATEAFLLYADNQELGPELADQRLQAKFRAAECMMLGGRPEESIGEFKALVEWASPGNSQGIDAKTAAAKRLRDVARMDVGYACDQTAEAVRPQLAELQDRAKAAAKEVASREKRIAENTQRLAALPRERAAVEEQAKAARAQYTEITLDFQEAARKTALGTLEEDPEKLTGALRDKALEHLRAETRRMLQAQEEQARQNVAGELASIDEEVVEINAAKDALAARIEQLIADSAQVRKQLPASGLAEPEGQGVAMLPALAGVLDASVDVLAREVAQAKESHEKKEAELATAVRELGALDVRRQALDASITTLRDDVDATNDAAEKARRIAKRDQAEGEMKDIQAKLDGAYARRGELEKSLEAAGKTLQQRTTTLEDAGARARKLAREIRHAALLDSLLSARLGASARTRPFAAKMAEALAQPAAARDAFRGELERLGAAAAKAVDAVCAARLALHEVEKTTATDVVAESQAALAAARAELSAAETALEPVRKQFEKWKQQAVAAFEAYLGVPDGDKDNRANVLAKLGTIFLELREFQKAEECLSRLNSEHPGSAAGAGALFNLARAQFETGKEAEASSTFGQLLARPADVSLANLQYIGRSMLDAGQFESALKACEQLVARSRDKSHPDYAQAKEIRATSLYRAGRAALGMKRPKEVLKYMDTLLQENPRSGFFYEVKFATAEARTLMTPPDLDGARRDLDEIFDSRDPVLKNRADCQLGEMWTATKDESLVKRGVSQLRIVVELADPAVPENLPWRERAAFAAAKAYARLGMDKDRDAMVRYYREHFPQGEHIDHLANLPPREFGK